MLAVGENSVLDTHSGFGRLQQIAVQLLGVGGIDLPVYDEVAFELDVSVAGVHIDAPGAASGRRDFGLDFARVGDETRVQGEVPKSVADIVFRIPRISAMQDVAEILGRCVGAFVDIYGLRLCRRQFRFLALRTISGQPILASLPQQKFDSPAL